MRFNGDVKQPLKQKGAFPTESVINEMAEKFKVSLQEFFKERFAALYAEILKSSAKNAKKVRKALNCLSSHFDANPEARNEPHIGHILSFRLSSRPMTWNKTTLKHLVSVLAAGQFVLKKSLPTIPLPWKNAKAQNIPFSPGLPNPLRPSLFLPVPVKLPLFLMPSPFLTQKFA